MTPIIRLRPRHISPRSREMACLLHEMLSLLDSWHLISIPHRRMLHVMRLIPRESAFSRRRAAFTTETDVLMMPHIVFRQTTKDLMLLRTQRLDPCVHVLEHLALDLGILIVEGGVEEALQNVLGELLNIDFVVVPCCEDSGDGVLDDDHGYMTSGLVQDQVLDF